MKLLIIFFFTIFSFSVANAQFYSETDVNSFLDNKTFKATSGTELRFTDMGGQLSINQNSTFFNPKITLVSSNSATIIYSPVQGSKMIKLMVNSKNNTITDLASRVIYSSSGDTRFDVFSRLAEMGQQNNTTSGTANKKGAGDKLNFDSKYVVEALRTGKFKNLETGFSIVFGFDISYPALASAVLRTNTLKKNILVYLDDVKEDNRYRIMTDDQDLPKFAKFRLDANGQVIEVILIWANQILTFQKVNDN